MGDGVGRHQPDRIGEADDFHLGFQGFPGNHAAVLHVVGDSTELLEKGFRAKEHGEAVAADLGVIGIEDADGGGDVEPVDGPAAEDVDRTRVHAHGEDGGGVFLLEGLTEFFDFGLEGALAVFFDAGGNIAVRGHVEVVGAGLGAGGEIFSLRGSILN